MRCDIPKNVFSSDSKRNRVNRKLSEFTFIYFLFNRTEHLYVNLRKRIIYVSVEHNSSILLFVKGEIPWVRTEHLSVPLRRRINS